VDLQTVLERFGGELNEVVPDEEMRPVALDA
jgi:hypothetical protein